MTAALEATILLVTCAAPVLLYAAGARFDPKAGGLAGAFFMSSSVSNIDWIGDDARIVFVGLMILASLRVLTAPPRAS